jgi:hypothetical protein
MAYLEEFKVTGPVLDAPVGEELFDCTLSLNQCLPILAKTGRLTG